MATTGKLNNMQVAKAKAGLKGDGGGLWLMTSKRKDGSLSKRFVFRWRKGEQFNELPLGAWPDVSLADARQRASELRGQIDDDRDPAAERRAAKIKAKADALKAKAEALMIAPMTFREATNDHIKAMGQKQWRTAKQAFDFRRGFERHVWPVIGDLAVDKIGAAEALRVLDQAYDRSPDLGRRLRERCEAVFARARARQVTTNPNPFDWATLKFAYPPKAPDQHLQAIPYQELPALFERLEALGDDPAALATRMQIALALRPGEAAALRFDWLDEVNQTATLPITKNGKSFVVPLNNAALEVVARAKELRSCDHLFPGRWGTRAITTKAIYKLVNRLTGATAHGVARSGFADWAYETNAASDVTIEAALNHSIGNATTRAYKRGDMLTARRKLGEAWSDFLLGRAAASNVVPFRVAE